MKNSSQDVEQQRQEAVAELGPDWVEQFAPGTFGCHELLDRTLLAAQTVEESVLAHPACAQNPAWYALAEQAVAALNQLYQQIGAADLADQSDEAGPP
jgi:hypothetical protein